MFSPSGKLQGLAAETAEPRELGFVIVLIPATQAQPGVGREQMRPNKALCVLGVCNLCLCRSLNHQQYKIQSPKQDINLDALLFLLGKGFYLCLDRFVAKLVDIIYRRIQIN